MEQRISSEAAPAPRNIPVGAYIETDAFQSAAQPSQPLPHANASATPAWPIPDENRPANTPAASPTHDLSKILAKTMQASLIRREANEATARLLDALERPAEGTATRLRELRRVFEEIRKDFYELQ